MASVEETMKKAEIRLDDNQQSIMKKLDETMETVNPNNWDTYNNQEKDLQTEEQKREQNSNKPNCSGITSAQRAAADKIQPSSQTATTEAQANASSTTRMIIGRTTENKQLKLNADATSYIYKAAGRVHSIPAVSENRNTGTVIEFCPTSSQHMDNAVYNGQSKSQQNTDQNQNNGANVPYWQLSQFHPQQMPVPIRLPLNFNTGSLGTLTQNAVHFGSYGQPAADINQLLAQREFMYQQLTEQINQKIAMNQQNTNMNGGQ